MGRVLRSLQGKLILTMIVLITANSVFFAVIAVITTRTHMQAIEQSLNKDLAKRIVSDRWLVDAIARGEPLATTFDRLMGINPSIEVYLLDLNGRILDYSAPEGHVVREEISTVPIEAFLAGERDFPIYGDDPRGDADSKVFSAARIRQDGAPGGYLYIVLGGEAYETIARMLQKDYALRLALGLAGGSVVVIILIGVATFHLLTKRFRVLAGEMRIFRESNFEHPLLGSQWKSAGLGDEIDEAGQTFQEMSRRISDQIQELEDSDLSRREMIANISHDLRTPLATLRGYLETLLMKEGELSDEVRRRYLELSLDYSERLSRLITELFELSTLDSQIADLEMVQFSIAELAQDVAEKSTLEADRKGIRFITEISPETPFVQGDIGLIERVFEKLIENAMRFTPADGVVRLVIAPAEDQVVARVEDSGPGVAGEDIVRIFDRFYRGNDVRHGRGPGAGLGLSIARRIVELHGGSIGVKSDERGASFFFSLPIARV